MQLSTVFQVSIYTQVAMAGVMLAYAEESVVPQAWTLPLVVLAFFFTERTGRFWISNFWANLFGLVAFIAAGFEFFSPNLEGRLLSGAHLLVYLTWIVLFQRKTAKQYWWMCALALMQVAVGSVLTQSGTYGLLMVLYLGLAMWTLSVFSLYQAERHFAGALAPLIAPERGGGGPTGSAGWGTSALTATGGTDGWGTFVGGRSRARWGVELAPHERWISPRFALGTFATTCVTLVVSALFFMLIPRVWIGKGMPTDDSPTDPVRALVGFTEEVQLGDIGEILESTERVLEVRLFDNDTDRRISMEQYTTRMGLDEPLFRGTVMGEYEDGRWRRGDLRREGTHEISQFPLRAGMVRQEIQLQPIGTNTLFALPPVERCQLVEIDARVERRFISGVLTWPHGDESKAPVAYTAYSSTDANAETVIPMRLPRLFTQKALQFYRTMPPGLERLAALSRRAAGAGGPERPADEELARRLVAYLRDSGQFSYSLNASISDASIDPVEDFLFNRKQGHCEYYASALALMLRSVGIPSRLISGFKGGVTSRFSDKFVVEQRHAHAWVEAYIDGRWVVLDATPAAARSESVDSVGRSFRSMRDLTSVVSSYWSKYVVNVTPRQQREAVYGPLYRGLEDLWESAKQGHLMDDMPAFILPMFQRLKDPRLWFSWRGGVATFVLLLLAYGGYRSVRGSIRRLRRWLGKLKEGGETRRRTVEFYERFRRVCALHGLERTSAQTQREFAAVVRHTLNQPLRAAGLAELPSELTDWFYRVRFGDVHLSDAQLATLDRRLSELERCTNGD